MGVLYVDDSFIPAVGFHFLSFGKIVWYFYPVQSRVRTVCLIDRFSLSPYSLTILGPSDLLFQKYKRQNDADALN